MAYKGLEEGAHGTHGPGETVSAGLTDVSCSHRQPLRFGTSVAHHDKSLFFGHITVQGRMCGSSLSSDSGPRLFVCPLFVGLNIRVPQGLALGPLLVAVYTHCLGDRISFLLTA